MKKIIIIITAAVLLLGIAAALYFLVLRDKPEPLPQNVTLSNETVNGTASNVIQVNLTQPDIDASIYNMLPNPNVEQKPKKAPEPEPQYFYNITAWDMDDFLSTLDKEIPGIKYIVPFGVRYLIGNETYFSYTSGVYTAVFYDPFWIIRSKYTSKVMEFPELDHFRMGIPITADQFWAEIEDKKTDSKLMSLYPDKYEVWMNLSCSQLTSCRDIMAIRCTRLAGEEKERPQLYVWTPVDAESRRMYDFPFNFQSDSLDNLRAFERMYCRPV
ncbi:MAG: hypothetical protein KJ709_08615 [Nanoarchaeota archaeon]|nr:hypothetical protein [Nanoarchaeota archaeon]